MRDLKFLKAKFKELPEYPQLTDGQKIFADTFFSGRNIFLSGAAGVGKSFIINLLSTFLAKNKVLVGKTASTGVASLSIGGQTIYSFCGVGLAEEDVNFLIKKIKGNKKVKERIKNTEVLILDEASMIKADLLDKIDVIFKYYRYNNKPFGGIKLIVVADFLQLPPVFKNDEEGDYCFNSRSWKEANFVPVILTEIMRQDNFDFAQLLNEIRVGKIDGNLKMLKICVNKKFPDDGIEPVRLFCKNINVREYNQKRLAELQGQSKVFHAKDVGQPHHIDFFDKNCLADKTLELKIGAQVMLLRNLDTKAGYINGSVGIIKSFTNGGVDVQFKYGRIIVDMAAWEIKEQERTLIGEIRYKVIASRTQIPLKVAYSSSIHKVQGLTLDRAEIDLNEAFGAGMCYVALSRVRNLESLSIKDFPLSKIKVDSECLDFYSKIVDKP